MRILIINSLYPTPNYPKTVGGAERSVRNIAESLVSIGHEVEVIRALPPGQSVSHELVSGVSVYSVPMRNLYWPFDGNVRHALKRLLWHLFDDWGSMPSVVGERMDIFKPDVVHTNTIAGLTCGVWRAAKRRNIRVVHTLRDYYLICARANYFRDGHTCGTPCLGCRVLTFRRRSMTKYVDAVVGNSGATLKLHTGQRLFNRARTKTSIGSLSDKGARRLPPRSSSRRTHFGFIGRVAPEKGVQLLAEAFGAYSDPDARLIIAGEADLSVQAELLAAARGRSIDFMGFVDPERFYEAVDVVVVPSLWEEPLPRSAIDAISYGRPVIGSARGGIPESMGKPRYGWIFEPDTPGDLLRAMAEASEAPLPSAPLEGEDPLKSYVACYTGGAERD